MPPFYSREQMIGDALQGLWGGIDRRRDQRIADTERARVEADRVRRQAQEDEDRRVAKRNQQLGEAITRLQMTQAGIRQGETPSAGAIPVPGPNGSLTLMADPGRYTALTDGFYVDRNATPEFKGAQATASAARDAEEKAQAKAAERNKLIGDALQQKDPALAMDMLLRGGMSGSEAKSVLDGSHPEPKAPVMGSPEWLKAQEQLASIQDRFAQAREGREASRKAGETAKLPLDAQKTTAALTAARGALVTYQQMLKETGTHLISGNDPGRARLAAQRSVAQTMLKDAYSLGALSDTDYKLLNQQIPDPTGFRAAISNETTQAASVQQVIDALGARVQSMQQSYGQSAPVTGGDTARTTTYSPNNPYARR